MTSQFDIQDYKLMYIVDDQFDDWPVNNIDFTIHLKENVAVDKRVVRRTSDHRPEYAYYYYDGVDYARRRFKFTLSTSGLVERREEFLSYYLQSGSLGPEFKIKDVTLDHAIVEELSTAILEQTKLRTDIVNHIKSIIMGVIQTGNPTWSVEQIIAATLPFFNELTTERIDFVEIGSSDYKQAVAAIDLQTTPHTYLAAEIAPGLTLRDYIVSLT